MTSVSEFTSAQWREQVALHEVDPEWDSFSKFLPLVPEPMRQNVESAMYKRDDMNESIFVRPGLKALFNVDV